jgi:hypothetical protein
MISNFTYRSDPVRIVFGAGAIAALRAEIEFHKISRLVVLCSPTRADFARRVTAPVADRCVGFCHTAGQHMPRQSRGGHHGPSLHRDRHHLFRLGNGGSLVYRRCR